MNALDAAYNTVHDHDGGAAALAPRMGMAQAILNSKVNPNTSTHHLRLDEANKLMAFTGNYSILHSLAFQHGFVCVRTPEAMPTDSNQIDLMDHYLELSKSKGLISVEIIKAKADGRICEKDVLAIDKALYEMECDIAEIRQALKDGLNQNQKTRKP